MPRRSFGIASVKPRRSLAAVVAVVAVVEVVAVAEAVVVAEAVAVVAATAARRTESSNALVRTRVEDPIYLC